MEVSADGSVTLTSKSHEVLGSAGFLGDGVVWPEGYDPDADSDDEPPLPISIGGEKVVACEDGCYLGSGLGPHSDDSTATFKRGEWQEAQEWLLQYYGSADYLDDAALEKIEAALKAK